MACPLRWAAHFPSSSPAPLVHGILSTATSLPRPPPLRTPAWVRARRSARQVGDWGQAGRGLPCGDEGLQPGRGAEVSPSKTPRETQPGKPRSPPGPPLPAGVSWPRSCLRGSLRGPPRLPRPTPPEGQGQLPPVTNVLWPQRLAQPLSQEPRQAPPLPLEFSAGVQPTPSPLLPPTWHLLRPDQKA